MSRPRRIALRALLWVCLGLATGCQAVPQPTTAEPELRVLAKWVQIVPAPIEDNGAQPGTVGALVRFVLPERSTCPPLAVEGGAGPEIATSPRGNPAPQRFPVVVCEALLPPFPGPVTLIFPDGQTHDLPALGRGMAPGEVAIVGDTGCPGLRTQRCAPPTWPFAEVAAQASGHKGNGGRKPRLVIHLGDYVYGGTDYWANWQAEFFTPARPLLEAAPWVFARGNHESCGANAGQGWMLFFDPRVGAATESCDEDWEKRFFFAPYALDPMAGLRLIVMDSANANRDTAGAQEAFAARFDQVMSSLIPPPGREEAVWLISHVAIWSVAGVEPETEVMKLPRHGTLHKALETTRHGERPLLGVDVVLSGDFHGYQKAWPLASDWPPVQYVAGNGGAKLGRLVLERPPEEMTDSVKESGEAFFPAGDTAAELRIAFETVVAFGFLRASPPEQGKAWRFTPIFLEQD